jgi:hypothetical protein
MIIDISHYCISIIGIESLAQEFNAHATFPRDGDVDTVNIKFNPEGTDLSLGQLETNFLQALQSFRIQRK